MKKLKRFALAALLLAGVGLGFASCSDDYYYEAPEKDIPLPGTDYPTKPGADPYQM